MSETFGSHESLSPQPQQSGREAEPRPGYPPPGLAEDQQALAAHEAADRAGENPEAVLAALETSVETADERATRLGEFVSTHFPDVGASNYLQAAVTECTLYEDDCREFFGQAYQLSEEDITADPTLRTTIETEVAAKAATAAANEAEIATQTDAVAEREEAVATNEIEVIPATETELAAVQVISERERAGLAADEAENAEVNRDLNNVQDLQGNFGELKAEHGTIGALQMLLDPEAGVQSPEMRAIVQRAINTAQAIVTALPGREAAVKQLLNSSGLDLTAASAAGMFAGLLSAAEASEDFSEAEVETLRRALGAEELEVDTGGDANEVFANGMLETYTDEDGNEQTRQVAMQPGDEVEYKNGHRLGVDERGGKYINIRTHVGLQFTSPLPDYPRDQDMGDIIRTAETRALLHTMNMAEAFYPQINFEEVNGGEMVIYPSDNIITERILGPLLGNRAIEGNALLSQADIHQAQHLLQFQNEKGDAVEGDVNPDQIRAAFQRNGTLTPDGTIDWARYTEMVEANRNGLWVSEENYNQAA